MRNRKVSELVLDFSVYPRMSVDSQHVTYMKEAVESGAKMPPVVICQKTMRVADGFHRVKAYGSLYGPEYEMEVIERPYRNDAELLTDAIRLNSAHGRALSRYDRTHCVLLAEKLKLSIDETARALNMTVEKLREMRVQRVGNVSVPGRRSGEPIPLKRTIMHMSGQTLTTQQAKVNEQLSGMNQMFYVNQLVSLIESDLLDAANSELVERLRHLGELIRKLKIAA